MICPNCEAEYREGFTVCSDCGVALVTELRAEVEVIEHEGLVPLHLTARSDELEDLLERIESAEVPYVVHAGTALALFEGRELGDAERPDPWQARILVAAPHFERARAILAELRNERMAVALARQRGVD